MIKKFLLLVFLFSSALSIHADGIVLKDKSDSLSYAYGLAYIAVFAGNTVKFIETEAGRESFIKGLEHQINKTTPTSTSYYVGGIQAVFILNTIEHYNNSFCVDGLIEGIRDGAEGNYTKMDTLQCKTFLSNYHKPSDDEEIRDSASFFKASYAYGMLRVCPVAFEVVMNEYGVAQSERSLKDFANGLIDILSVKRIPKDSYEYGLQIGTSILMGINDSESIRINPLIMVQALKDFILQRPLLIPREQAERMIEQGFNEMDPKYNELE